MCGLNSACVCGIKLCGVLCGLNSVCVVCGWVHVCVWWGLNNVVILCLIMVS